MTDTRVQLTLLNNMAGGPDLAPVLDRYVGLGLNLVDLKDRIWGHSIETLPLEKARHAATLLRERGLGVFCLSTSIGFFDLGEGEAAWRARQEAALSHVLEVAPIFEPQVVRLLAARWTKAPDEANIETIDEWVFESYRNLIDRLESAGFSVTIENEVHGCILTNPADVSAFWARLGRPVSFTWDVQNLWQMGTFPSLEVYRQLRPLVGGLHLKGGRSENGHTLRWASGLEDASWPVKEIVQAVVDDGNVPVLCLNPSHGEAPPGYDGWAVAQKNVAFLRREIRSLR